MKAEIKRLSKFQVIWTLAKRNGTIQDFDSLPTQNWEWPTATFLQRRLAELRKREVEREQ